MTKRSCEWCARLFNPREAKQRFDTEGCRYAYHTARKSEGLRLLREKQEARAQVEQFICEEAAE